jgi:hypothetical protein
MATRRTFLQDSAALDAGIMLTQAQTVRAAEEPGLHTIYWTSISGKGGEPKGNLAKIIDRNFGSYAKFKAQLVAATIAVEASGWGVVGYHPATGKLVVIRHRCHRHDPSRGRDSRGIEFHCRTGNKAGGVSDRRHLRRAVSGQFRELIDLAAGCGEQRHRASRRLGLWRNVFRHSAAP